MNPDLAKLKPYPFERLRTLLADITPPENGGIALSIGEPKHEAPKFVLDRLRDSLAEISAYPTTLGRQDLRESISAWLTKRFSLSSVNPSMEVLPVNGTREALFAFAQCVADRSKDGVVLMPNPFYQIYEGASYLAGLKPHYYATERDNAYLPDFDAIDEKTWQQTQLIYLCSPSNPTGRVLSKESLIALIIKAEKYDFVIASDECYSEIYFDEASAPVGLLEAAAAMDNTAFKRCVAFHSLSKRSNLPGLRSGFVAGDAELLKQFLLFRTYHGCSMSVPTQIASALAWGDEEHVKTNRRLYREKFRAVLEILKPVLDVSLPDASFYLWPHLPIDDEQFTRLLYEQHGIVVLPGSYLSSTVDGKTPGQNHVRIALVAQQADCVTAAEQIRQTVASL